MHDGDKAGLIAFGNGAIGPRRACSGYRLLLAVLFILAGSVPAYEKPVPRFIQAEVTFKDAEAGKERTVKGELWFADLPVREGGRVRGFGRIGYYTGIKWFVPLKAGDIWIRRIDGGEDPHTVTLHDYYGERPITLAFDEISVTISDQAKLKNLMEARVDRMSSSERSSGGGSDRTQLNLEDDSNTSLDDLPTGKPATPGKATGPSSAKAQAGAAASAGPPPLVLALEDPGTLKSIPVRDLVHISFLAASDGLKREMYTGRFIEYSNQATGDEGRVQVKAATFFGGKESERFDYGEFINDGSIMMGGNFRDLSFVDPKLMKILGPDPAADAYPPEERKDPRRGVTTVHPRTTAVLVHYTPDLTRLIEVIRLPWGTGTINGLFFGPDDAVYLTGITGPHFGVFSKSVKTCSVVDPPQVPPGAKSAAPGPDGFALRISPDRQRVEWLVQFKQSAVNAFRRTDGRIVVRRGDWLFHVDPAGTVANGPKLDISGGKMSVDPRNGAMYFCGSYRSATGLEPYVCPFIYKVDQNGKQVWTGYSWTGPIAGTNQFRLVSDSSVLAVKVAEDGSLALRAWSDGGNTVLAKQPYDMRREAPLSGFATSTWGASGLTVRIGHLIHMNAETMEVDHRTGFVAYSPTSDIPMITNFYDSQPLPNGELAITGSSAVGLIETHDAWVPSWYVEHRTDEHAQAKGGTFFTLFSKDYSKPRMSTRTPGVGNGQLTGKGNLLLLYGGATSPPATAEDKRWARVFRPIIRNAVQPEYGGASDAYVMLIDANAPPNPPIIPVKTWGDPDKSKKRGR